MNLKAFTLMEVLLTITIMSIIVAFTVPNYRKSVEKAHSRDMVTQLETLHAANTMYFASQRTYYINTTPSLVVLNQNLNINLISNDGTTYSYNCAGPGGASYTFDATWGGFTIRITDAPISSTNPICQAGSCPTL